MMEAEVSFGAAMPAKAAVSNPGTVSATADTSGNKSSRVGELTPSARRPAVLMYWIEDGRLDHDMHMAPEQVGQGRAPQ
jgi:hypothetical protein